MNNKSKRLNAYFSVLPIAIIIAVTLRTVAAFTAFDFVYGYFNDKTLITVANSLTVAVCVLFFTYVLIAQKDKKLIASFSTPATYVPTGAVCAALVMFSAYTFNRIAGYGLSVFDAIATKNYLILFEAVIGILSLLSAVYFILAAINSERASTTRASFGIVAVVFLAAYASLLYFDTSLPLNAPNKILDQMALLFTALFFLYETRISLGREKWHLYIGFGLIAAYLTAYSAIPSVIVYFVKARTLSESVYENALTLALFIFIIARLILAFSLKKDEESEFITALKEASDKRDEKLTEKEEIRRLAYIELMSKVAQSEEGEEFFGTESEEGFEYSEIGEEETLAEGDGAVAFEETVFSPVPETDESDYAVQATDEQNSFAEDGELTTEQDVGSEN